MSLWLILKRGYNTLGLRLRPTLPSLLLCLLLNAAPSFSGEKPSVAVGIDVLEQQEFAPLIRADKRETRIGLVTNATGVDSEGRRTIDVLANATGVKLVAIFSPEHGIATKVDAADIEDAKDQSTGISVYSIYGRTDAQRRPRQELLHGLDAVVLDLQDAGVRFYTYETTLGYFLEACAAAGVEMIVLDRPNPINGITVQGPISTSPQSFVNYHPLPIRHGMTLGELARFFNGERKIKAKLRVVPMQGWKRDQWFDDTGIPWVNPSPALRNLNAEALYPGVALLEQTNVSVGRGTNTPFEVVGAPWIDGQRFSQYMSRRRLTGVRFQPAEFIPTASTLAGKDCKGVSISITERNLLNSPAIGIELAAALLRLYPKRFEVNAMKPLLANDAELARLTKRDQPKDIVAEWQAPVREFKKKRRPYLLYPELR